MWVFTQHVLVRMRERGYTHNDILRVLHGEVPALIYPSPQEKSVDLYFGLVDNKYMMIPVDRDKKTIITVRPMRKIEKQIYLQEVRHA
jgi:hypothetical protein